MIRADDIAVGSDGDFDFSQQEKVETELSIEDQALLYALDASVDDRAAYCRPGKMFEIKITRSMPLDVVGALKRTWEAGNWVVDAFEILNPATGRPLREGDGEADEQVIRLVFARPHREQRLPAQHVVDALAARSEAAEFVLPDDATIARIVSGSVRTSTPLLVRMPTRSRPVQALEVLTKYREMATEHVAIEVVIDEDDASCNETRFLQRLSDLDCVVTVGRHKNKIEACNAGRVDDWSVIMLASDDMVPIVLGYDQKILDAMEKNFPLYDGAINFSDGYNKDHVREGEPITNTLPIYGRYLYEEIGRQIYWPEFRSIYCDTDRSFLFDKMKRMTFVDEIIVEHRHFANDKARFDELYQHNARHDDHDRLLFEARRARGFDYVPPMLSILICAMPERRAQLDRLVDYLRWQMRAHAGTVEICVDLDPSITVGAKRQRLLERAVGDYVCFVDDDDWVAHDYIERIVHALDYRTNAGLPSVDCLSLVGVITENGENPRRFEHSIKYREWRTTTDADGLPFYERSPNHLNCVWRELALEVGFTPRSVGEDHVFSDQLRPLLKSEASTGDAPLYYYWSRPQQSVQSRGGE